MVKPPGKVRLHFYSLNQFYHPVGQLRGTRGSILHLKQSPWKSKEIMDGGRRFHRSHLRAVSLPVGGNAKDGFRFWDLFGSFLPGTAVFVILDGIHWVAVPDKQGRHDLIAHNVFPSPFSKVTRMP